MAGNGLRRRGRDGEARTLYSLAESTRLAWDRVRQSYAAGGAARTYSFADVRRGYRAWDPLTSRTVFVVVVVALVGLLLPETYRSRENIATMMSTVRTNIIEVAVLLGALCACVLAYSVRKPRPVYLMDSEVYVPPKRLHVSVDRYMETTLTTKRVDEESAEFQRKILTKSASDRRARSPRASSNTATKFRRQAVM